MYEDRWDLHLLEIQAKCNSDISPSGYSPQMMHNIDMRVPPKPMRAIQVLQQVNIVPVAFTDDEEERLRYLSDYRTLRQKTYQIEM